MLLEKVYTTGVGGKAGDAPPGEPISHAQDPADLSRIPKVKNVLWLQLAHIG